MKGTVFLVRNIEPSMYGGGETYQLKLARLLSKNGFEPFIVSSSHELLKEAKKNGFKVIKAPYINRQVWSGWRNILFPVYYIKIMRLRGWYKKVFTKYKPSVVNIQSRDDWIAATVTAKKMRMKVVWTDHMDLRSWVLENVNVWYKNWIGKWLLKIAKKTDRIIMISDFEKKCFDNLVGRRTFKNIVVIKNGVEDELKSYKNTNIKNDSFCYVGRIVDYKGISELIAAFIKIVEKYPKAKLNIYGGGDVKKYKNMCKGYCNIKFYGKTETPLKVLAENEIFVLPSYREGLSLSLLDAVMMKKKIIASDVDGNPEVVVNGETGLLVPVKNIDKLSEAMVWMLNNKNKAERMAQNARVRYENQFDFKKIFEEKMLPLYNKKEEEK